MTTAFLRTLLFDFDGRVSRLPYLAAVSGVCVFMIGASAVFWLAFMTVLNWHTPTGKSAVIFAEFIMAAAVWAVAMGASGWAGLALAAKRVRDAGLPVSLSLVAYFTALFFDMGVLAPVLRGGSFGPLTGFGAAVYASAWIVLLLAPSRNENAPSAGGEGVPEAIPA